MTSSALPRVAVVGTGGTISSIGKDSLDIVRYGENGQQHHVEALLRAVPETASVADLIPAPYKAVGSTEIGSNNWLDLLTFVEELAEKEKPDGIVITHGTATLEETAYFLNLTVRNPVPVVIVGSQRPISSISTDGAINLVNAIRVAGQPDARGMGVLVLLNDEIHAAREVTKTSTLRMQAFRSHDFGILGHADADKISFYRRPTRTTAPDAEFDVRGWSSLPRVDIPYSYAGADGTAIDAYVAAGARGLVSAGFAPGGCTPAERAAYQRAIDAGVVMVISTRAGSGRVVETSGHRPEGGIPADNLMPQKARILLMLALTRSADPAEIRRMFATY